MGKINEGLFHELLTPRTTYADANFPVHFPGKLVFHHAIRTTETAEKKKNPLSIAASNLASIRAERAPSWHV